MLKSEKPRDRAALHAKPTGTVDTHVERVLSKLEGTSRTPAFAIAMRLGLASRSNPAALDSGYNCP